MQKNSDKFNSFVSNYWEYYRQLDADFYSLRRYIDFSEKNYKTFSVELLKLYQSACSEIDVVGKFIASEANNSFMPQDKNNNILKWWYEIQNSVQYEDDDKTVYQLKNSTVKLLNSIPLCPWKNFIVTKNNNRFVHNGSLPFWWDDYNKVKHGRAYTLDASGAKNYEKANFKNTLNAYAALYILEKSYMNAIGTRDDIEALISTSSLFDFQQGLTTSEVERIFSET